MQYGFAPHGACRQLVRRLQLLVQIFLIFFYLTGRQDQVLVQAARTGRSRQLFRRQRRPSAREIVQDEPAVRFTVDDLRHGGGLSEAEKLEEYEGLLRCLEWRYQGDIIEAIESFCGRFPRDLQRFCGARALSVATALRPYTALPVAGEERHQRTRVLICCSELSRPAVVSPSESTYGLK
ncbi:hypothetical protein CSUI_009093 [Cystoisospora suis]|uniref:Uncharacterized protein n=1 Tax=Cystoisospora suis TaxID=483139 RepID=A0A2C6KHR3_9APIC|nr:hypothetical protein CSUI_009093 [Cystoisospora suis]